MGKKIKNITALLFLFVFLLPSVVKIEHHHKHVLNISAGEKHQQAFREKCSICDFEFSVFIDIVKNNDCQKKNPSDNYSNNYNSRYNSNISQFSFLLRAPPLNIHS
jgi:hypothetical protein